MTMMKLIRLNRMLKHKAASSSKGSNYFISRFLTSRISFYALMFKSKLMKKSFEAFQGKLRTVCVILKKKKLQNLRQMIICDMFAQ